MVDRDELLRRYAPNLVAPNLLTREQASVEAPEREQTDESNDAPVRQPLEPAAGVSWPVSGSITYPPISTTSSPTFPTVVDSTAHQERGRQETEKQEPGGRAFVLNVGGRTLISAPAGVVEHAGRPSVEEVAKNPMLWIHGRFVGAERANRNGAFWSSGDLELGERTVANGPLNWLHEERHIIGSIAKAELVKPQQTGRQMAADTAQPHITATAGIWRWIWPDEARVVQLASDAQRVWFSMECISEKVQCCGDNGCGAELSYDQYMSGLACDHMKQRTATRRFVNPTFLGGAVIVPPAAPGWADADASVMKEATTQAEAAFDQAGRPDIPSTEWELMLAQLIGYLQN